MSVTQAVEAVLENQGRIPFLKLVETLASVDIADPIGYIHELMLDWRIDIDIDQGAAWVHAGRFVESAWDRFDERRACAEEGSEPDEYMWRKESAEAVRERQRLRVSGTNIWRFPQ